MCSVGQLFTLTGSSLLLSWYVNAKRSDGELVGSMGGGGGLRWRWFLASLQLRFHSPEPPPYGVMVDHVITLLSCAGLTVSQWSLAVQSRYEIGEGKVHCKQRWVRVRTPPTPVFNAVVAEGRILQQTALLYSLQ